MSIGKDGKAEKKIFFKYYLLLVNMSGVTSDYSKLLERQTVSYAYLPGAFIDFHVFKSKSIDCGILS